MYTPSNFKPPCRGHVLIYRYGYTYIMNLCIYLGISVEILGKTWKVRASSKVGVSTTA